MKEETWEGEESALTAYRGPLTPVYYFKYLERILSELDDDWLTVVHNLIWVLKKWERLTRLLGREGTDAWTSGMFYVEVVQVVMLYGSETWVMSLHIGITLSIFHHRVDRILMECQLCRGLYRIWVYPLLVEDIAEAVLKEVETYVYRPPKTAAH